MTREELDKANKISANLELIGKVLDLVPTGCNYGAKWELRLSDKDVVCQLVWLYDGEFIDILLRHKKELEEELKEL